MIEEISLNNLENAKFLLKYFQEKYIKFLEKFFKKEFLELNEEHVQCINKFIESFNKFSMTILKDFEFLQDDTLKEKLLVEMLEICFEFMGELQKLDQKFEFEIDLKSIEDLYSIFYRKYLYFLKNNI